MAEQGFQLSAGQVSAGLQRNRLWRLSSGTARLRVTTDGGRIVECRIPTSGWFVVPDSPAFRMQLVAETDVVFRPRLELTYVSRLGDLGRQQLIEPIQALLAALAVDDTQVVWSTQLAQPQFGAWFGRALTDAIDTGEALSSQMRSPLEAGTASATARLSDRLASSPALTWVPGVVLAVVTLISLLLALRLWSTAAFELTPDAPWIVAILGGLSVLGCVVLSRQSVMRPREARLSLAVLLVLSIGWVGWSFPILGLLMVILTAAVGVAYLVLVRRLLVDLPEIHQPIRWLSGRLAREGIPSLRGRLLAAWSQMADWVVARIELTAEFSRLSRALLAGSLIVPAYAAATVPSSQVDVVVLALVGVVALERLRSLLPVDPKGVETARGDALQTSLSLRGECQWDRIVYRRHAGEAPLFHELSFQCPAGSLVRITAPEGAGLTTLRELLIRRVAPERGVVRIDGIDVARLPNRDLARLVIGLDHPDDGDAVSVADWFYVDPTVTPQALDLHLRQLEILTSIDQLSRGVESPIGELIARVGPLGMTRLKLARALSRTGSIVWLDHWLVGLAPSHRAHVVHSLVTRTGTRFVVDRNAFLTPFADLTWDLGHAGH
ncbi:MAG: hypothetical protein EBS77_04160 [Gammaproteobacteria bacterium]|nr:hypothetical protein [Gammaproteobacteria bacterium]